MKDGRGQEEPPSTSEKGLRGLEPTVVSTLGLVHLAHTGLSSPSFPQTESSYRFLVWLFLTLYMGLETIIKQTSKRDNKGHRQASFLAQDAILPIVGDSFSLGFS